MKRSKKMFTRFTSMLHNAVEALAPEMTLLEQFRYHWKSVTQFFLDTTDERVSVESTAIPHHLQQMIQVLQLEEQENGTGSAGPAMEFMLQHKILETMQALGKADCPPGMKRQVLIFFTHLLGKSRIQLLPHVNVHKPINKMIRCCGDVKAAPTESEEVQFLLQVSSKLKQDSYLVNFFLEAPGTSEGGSSPTLSPGLEREREKPEYSLVDALLALMKSEDSRVAIKACEGLLLCTSISEDQAAMTIVLYTAFCERMADQLAKLFRSLPAVIDPADLNQLSARWGLDHEDQNIHSFPGKRPLIAFISWLDYVNQLSVEAHPMVAKSLAGAISERFISTAIEPGLSQASEPCAITVTAILTRCLKLVTSQTLAQEFANILLGEDTKPEIPEYHSPHKLRHLLIQRINHLSDQLAIETLRLFQALLMLPYQPILDTLLIRNFTKRNYIDFEKESIRKSANQNSNTTTNGPVVSSEVNDSLNVATQEDSTIQNEDNTVRNSENDNQETPSGSKTEDNAGSEPEISTDITQNSDNINPSDNFPAKTEELNDSPAKTEELNDSPAKTKENNVTTTPNELAQSDSVDGTAIVKDTDSVDGTAIVKDTDSVDGTAIVKDTDSVDGTAIVKDTDSVDGTTIVKDTDSVDGTAIVKDTDSVDGTVIVKDTDSVDGTVIVKDTEPLPEQQHIDRGTHEASMEPDVNTTFSKKRIEKAVNGFLLILPDSLKSSQTVGETGYDSYLRDAHKQCQLRAAQSFAFNWPTLKELDAASITDVEETPFYEGAFLHTIFNRLARLQDQVEKKCDVLQEKGTSQDVGVNNQPYDVNLEVTAIVSLICQFPHPYLHEFLMDTSGLSKDNILTLHRILLKACHDVKDRSERLGNNQDSLTSVRKHLMHVSDEGVELTNQSFLESVIILEEFCKELAAIAFVTATMNLD